MATGAPVVSVENVEKAVGFLAAAVTESPIRVSVYRGRPNIALPGLCISVVDSGCGCSF